MAAHIAHGLLGRQQQGLPGRGGQRHTGVEELGADHRPAAPAHLVLDDLAQRRLQVSQVVPPGVGAWRVLGGGKHDLQGLTGLVAYLLVGGAPDPAGGDQGGNDPVVDHAGHHPAGPDT